MPIIKSAKKTLRSDKYKTKTNNLTRAKIKDALKAARISVDKGEKNAQEKISKAYRELDIASKKNVIHKNKAGRLKSRLSKRAQKKSNTN